MMEPGRRRRSASGHRERVAAAAAGRLVGVLELEALEHHRLLPVEHRAAEVEDALLVAEDADRALILLGELEDQIACARRVVVELDRIREAGAAAALDTDADRALRC